MDAFLEAHILGLKHSLDTMPASSYRDYLHNLLSQNPVNGEWLKLISLEPTVGMTMKLLDGVLEPQEIDAILPYIVMMNVFLVYEVVSDNLAIGLIKASPQDERRQVLKVFNETSVLRLLGVEIDYEAQFRPYEKAFERISTFEQSLSPHKHHKFAAEYSAQNPSADMHAIEYSLYPQLVANMDGAKAVIDSLAGTRSQELVRTSMIRRYRDGGVWLHRANFDFEDLFYFGTGSILVIPTLAYYIAVIGEILRKFKKVRFIIEDKSLAKALEIAALLVRLLNDIGTYLLRSDDAARSAVVRDVQTRTTQTGLSLNAVIPDLFEENPQVYTRLRKDVHFGEYNLLLASLPPHNAIDKFGSHLHIFAHRYQKSRAELEVILNQIDNRLGERFVSIIIWRFVLFHEGLYANASNLPEGEYAI